jgi:hypothetical protein
MRTSEETPTLSDLYLTLLHNDLDVLGDQVIHSEGKIRLYYWKVFQVSPTSIGSHIILKYWFTLSYQGCRDIVVHFSHSGMFLSLHFISQQQAYDAFPLNGVAHGRIYNRYRMCKIAVAATIAKELAQGNAINEFIGEFPSVPLTEWGTDDWSALEEYVEGTAISLIRKDADRMANVKENDAVDGRRGRSALYKQKLDKVLKYIKVHQTLSPFRNVLSSQIDNEELDGSEFPKIDKKLVKEFS